MYICIKIDMENSTYVIDMGDIHENHKSIFHVEFNDSFKELEVTLNKGDSAKLFDSLEGRDVKYIKEDYYTLEDDFKEVYRRGENK